MQPVLAFDLDLTLADTRAGAREALTALSRESGRVINLDEAEARLGIPVADELAHWFPADEVQQAALRLRALFLDVGVPLATAFDGVATTLTALAARGVGAWVVTSRHPHVAAALLRETELEPLIAGMDGMAFGPQKVPALLRISPLAYVGDHPADMAAALEAGVLAIGVTTGNHDALVLKEAGAAVVLDGLAGLLDLDM